MWIVRDEHYTWKRVTMGCGYVTKEWSLGDCSSDHQLETTLGQIFVELVSWTKQTPQNKIYEVFLLHGTFCSFAPAFCYKVSCILQFSVFMVREGISLVCSPVTSAVLECRLRMVDRLSS